MPVIAPMADELSNLVSKPLYEVWNKLVALIDENYDMERLWNSGGKVWKYEYKYRRGGKTLARSMREKIVSGLWLFSGKDERAKFEQDKADYLEETRAVYAQAQTYHDGKWMCLSQRIPQCLMIF